MKTKHKMKDGRTIDIASMTTRHLINTMRMIIRTANEGPIISEIRMFPGESEYIMTTREEIIEKSGFNSYAIELLHRIQPDLSFKDSWTNG